MILNGSFKKTPYNLNSLAKIMDASYAYEPSEIEYIQKKTFSPSVIGYGHGQCPRYWPLVFRGGEFVINHDAASKDSMKSGTDAHARIQSNFQNSDLNIECEREIISNDPPIRGFADMIIHDFEGFTIPVEIKTTRAEAFAFRQAKRTPPSYHEIQLLIYMHILDTKYGLFLYENKNDHSKLLLPLEMTESNKTKVQEVFSWMRNIYSRYENDDLPEIPYRKNSKICKNCPINDYCHNQPEGNIKVDPLNYENIQSESAW